MSLLIKVTPVLARADGNAADERGIDSISEPAIIAGGCSERVSWWRRFVSSVSRCWLPPSVGRIIKLFPRKLQAALKVVKFTGGHPRCS
jgi:hypothetical protein